MILVDSRSASELRSLDGGPRALNSDEAFVDAAERMKCSDDFLDGELEAMVDWDVCCWRVEIARVCEET
jgi:hypothetical protein